MTSWNIVYVLKVIVLMSLVNAEDITVTEVTEIANETNYSNETEIQTEWNDTICAICDCMNGTADCRDRNIKSPFSLQEWEGLTPFNPTTVDLSNNPIQELKLIAELPVQHLIASNCDINRIENHAFKNLAELVTLDLSHNRICTNSLSKRVFEITPHKPRLFLKLQTLDLSYNDIYSLPQDIFLSMPGVTSLDLSGNPLAYIDQLTMAALAELLKLKELNLSSCELEALPEGVFRRHRRLKRLDLSDNRFTTIPTAVAEPINLVYLNFNKNPIEILEEGSAIKSLTKLRELSLCRLSKLKAIRSGALAGLVNLTSLMICHNPRLTELDPHFLMWMDDDIERYPRLEKLHLYSNNLSYIDPHILDRWDKLQDVDFTNNPYVCNCNSSWMVTVLVPLIMSSDCKETVQNMICKKPEKLRGLSFSKLREMSTALVCEETRNLAPESDSVILLGIMIGIFTTFPLVIILMLLWKKGYLSRYRRKMIRDKHYNFDEEDDL